MVSIKLLYGGPSKQYFEIMGHIVGQQLKISEVYKWKNKKVEEKVTIRADKKTVKLQ